MTSTPRQYQRFTWAEVLAAVSALGLLADGFLPWTKRGDVTITAWENFTFLDFVLLLAIAACLVNIVVCLISEGPPAPLFAAVLATWLSLAATIGSIFAALSGGPSGETLAYGALLAPGFGLVMLVSSWVSMRDQRPRFQKRVASFDLRS